MLRLLLCAILIALLSGCGHHTVPVSPSNPPQGGQSDVFLVGNLSGQVAGFSVQAGKLVRLAGALAQFPFPLDNIAAQPNGSLLVAVSGPGTTGNNAQTAVLNPGDLLALQAKFSLTAPSAVDVSQGGLIAATDENDDLVQILAVQNNQVSLASTAMTGPSPRAVLFSTDGRVLYVANSFGSSISTFSVSDGGLLQLRQTLQLPLAAGELTAPVVRIRLSPSGDKLAATTAAGQLYISTVNSTDRTLSGTQETRVPSNANLEEVIFDPSGQDVYTADLDNGLIYGFSVAAQGNAVSLPGSPYSASPSPSGLAVNSQGTRVYAVLSATSEVVTFSRSTTGQLSPTGEAISSGGILAGRIIRVVAP